VNESTTVPKAAKKMNSEPFLSKGAWEASVDGFSSESSRHEFDVSLWSRLLDHREFALGLTLQINVGYRFRIFNLTLFLRQPVLKVPLLELVEMSSVDHLLSGVS